MPDCLFCRIIAGQIPGAIVHQDDTLVAFKDINPQAPLHVLIVPRKHIPTLNDLSPDDDALVGAMHRRAAALGLPVLLHPLRVVGAERLAPFYLGNFLGNPFDTAIAAAHLVFGGVLDRLPKLEVCLPHAGGALPYLHGRLRHGQRVRPETKGVAKKPFSAYLRRFTYDIISHDSAALRYLVATVGADRVMLGTDFCFDMGYDRPLAIIQAKATGLGLKDQRRVVRDNAARVLHLV